MAGYQKKAYAHPSWPPIANNLIKQTFTRYLIANLV